MLISEKMWEDNFVHPQHIVSMFNCQIVSKKEFLLLQLFTLNRLQYDVNVSEMRFGKLLKDIMKRGVPSIVVEVPLFFRDLSLLTVGRASGPLLHLIVFLILSAGHK